jgi:hypothetical protein
MMGENGTGQYGGGGVTRRQYLREEGDILVPLDDQVELEAGPEHGHLSRHIHITVCIERRGGRGGRISQGKSLPMVLSY